MKFPAVVFTALIALVPVCAQSTTWRVAKDGSGSFTVIQDAVNVSAPGDTILIGPGRYDETAPYYLINSWTAETCVGVGIENITLLGEDRDSVIIGPSTPNYSGNGPHGIVSQIGIQHFFIENLTVENWYLGMTVFGQVSVENCKIFGCDIGIYGFAENGLLVDACIFSDCDSGVLTQDPTRDVVIRGCTFIENSTGVSFVSSPNSLVTDCIFSGGTGGVQFDRGTTGSIDNCTITGKSNYNVTCIYSQMEIRDNFFGISYYGSIFKRHSVVTGSGNIFEGGVASTFRLEEGAEVSLHNNHIFFDTGYSIWIRGGTGYVDGPDVFLNFQDNYWGTTNVDSIAASIFDGNDEPTYNAYVNFLPIADGPVPTESRSFGSIKAMFR